jgi:hypothetical protein
MNTRQWRKHTYRKERSDVKYLRKISHIRNQQTEHTVQLNDNFTGIYNPMYNKNNNNNNNNNKLNSVVLVRKRTIKTERPQPAGKVSANFS